MSSSSKPVTTMAHIARLAGVHVSTVSRALGDSPLVEKSMRDRILKIAHQHGYVANSTARNLRAGRTQTLSVVIPLAHERGQDLTDPFFAYMLSHLADEITQRGYGMHLQKVLPPMQGWMQRMVAERRSDGIIAISAMRAVSASGLKIPDDIAVVGFDGIDMGAHVHPTLTTVAQDLNRGARLLVDLLLKRIAGEAVESVAMAGELVVRESCGAVRTANL